MARHVERCGDQKRCAEYFAMLSSRTHVSIVVLCLSRSECRDSYKEKGKSDCASFVGHLKLSGMSSV